MRYIPQKYLDAGRCGAEYVPIRYTVGGIKVYKKTVLFKDVLSHVQKLTFQAYDALYDLRDETPKAKTMEELVNDLLRSSSGFVGEPMTNRDVESYVISKLQEAIAVLRFLGKA